MENNEIKSFVIGDDNFSLEGLKQAFIDAAGGGEAAEKLQQDYYSRTRGGGQKVVSEGQILTLKGFKIGQSKNISQPWIDVLFTQGARNVTISLVSLIGKSVGDVQGNLDVIAGMTVDEALDYLAKNQGLRVKCIAAEQAVRKTKWDEVTESYVDMPEKDWKKTWVYTLKKD